MNDPITIIKNNGIGVMPTDTIYGIVGQALSQDAVEKIYTVKQRTPSKPFIILISNPSDLALFDIHITPSIQASLDLYWPGPVSIILECHNPKFGYLHRGTESLAFRLPNVPELIEFIKQTGPLVAPSANPEGLPPSKDIVEAKAYFGNSVDFYLEGPVNTKASKIIRITERGEEIIRP